MSNDTATNTFWDANPCDGQPSWAARRAFRYHKEAWLLNEFPGIAVYRRVLEVGCGQGTDAIEICRSMAAGSEYWAIDESNESIASANCAIAEAELQTVRPIMKRASALALPFDNSSFDAIYSMGVLHHLEDTERAISEVYRVLRNGGLALIVLYNSESPKVQMALLLRSLQRLLDRVLGSDKCLLSLTRRVKSDFVGTALLECFGVPILKAYSPNKMRTLFASFDIIRLEKHGPQGSFWLVEARKR